MNLNRNGVDQCQNVSSRWPVMSLREQPNFTTGEGMKLRSEVERTGCEVRFLCCVGAAARRTSPRGVVILSTLITGLDGRSNFERNGGALAPLLHLPLAHCYGQ